MADSSYLNFVLILSGVAIFLIIKLVSDISYRNRALFVWQANSPNKRVQTKIRVENFLKMVTLRKIKNKSIFITKDLPISINTY